VASDLALITSSLVNIVVKRNSFYTFTLWDQYNVSMATDTMIYRNSMLEYISTVRIMLLEKNLVL